MDEICYRRARTAGDTCKVIEAALSVSAGVVSTPYDGRDFVVFVRTSGVEQRARFAAACSELSV